jgi:hypothetical protein
MIQKPLQENINHSGKDLVTTLPRNKLRLMDSLIYLVFVPLLQQVSLARKRLASSLNTTECHLFQAQEDGKPITLDLID